MDDCSQPMSWVEQHRLQLEQLQQYHHLDHELQPSDHLTSDLLHYAEDPPSHAGLHSHPTLGLVSQPCLADGHQSMFGLNCRSAVAHNCGRRIRCICRRLLRSVSRRTDFVVDRTLFFADRAFQEC